MKRTNGVVVSAHSLASEAGASILRKGGNAFDAAVATSLMLGVVEPAFFGIGGGGLSLLWRASGECVALDYREVAPLGASGSMFGKTEDDNRVGPLAVATPGLLAGHSKIIEEYGTMKFRDLARPAIQAAKSGVRRKRLSRDILKDNTWGTADKVKGFRTSSEAYVGRNRFPLLAATLSRLARDGPDAFYQGSIPEMMARHVEGLGGVLCEDDFHRYSVKERKPVRTSYRGNELLLMPPPSAGGVLLAHGFRILDEFNGGADGQGETCRLLRMARILKAMLGEKWRFGDPEFTDVPVKELLSATVVKRKAREIASSEEWPSKGLPDGPGSTSHFCVVDRMGNAVTATETIECYYGSGVTVPGLGIVLNDEMHDFDLTPGRPNSVEPLKRPVSSMTPTMMLREGDPFLLLGGAGSERIISSIFQVIDNVIERRMSLSDAVSSPRIHPSDEALMIEGGFGPSTVAGLEEVVPKVKVRKSNDFYFGGVQAAMVDAGSGRVTGVADPRRMGAAVLA